jgi:hypothetical protein
MAANQVCDSLSFPQSRFHVRQIRTPPLLPHSDRIDVYHRPSLFIHGRIFSVFVFACPVFDSHVFTTAESFAGVETRGTGVMGNECAEEGVRCMLIDGIFISVYVDLTIDINERLRYWYR